MILKLVPSDARVLRQLCRPVDAVPYWFTSEMMSLMLQSKGAGLAAPQVGCPIRLFVTQWGDAFINPVITAHSDNTTTALEGCLSLPGVLVAVPRYDWVRLGNEVYCGFNARVIQHEMDHLDGKLITDYLQPSGNQTRPVGQAALPHAG